MFLKLTVKVSTQPVVPTSKYFSSFAKQRSQYAFGGRKVTPQVSQRVARNVPLSFTARKNVSPASPKV